MKRKMNKKGFTLIELLAVIVILGIIMGIAIPSMTGYIANSRKDTMLSTALQYINGARTLLVTENSLPGYGEAIVVPVDLVGLEKGGTSPFTSKVFSNNYSGSTYDGRSYVLVMNNKTSGNIDTVSSYTYIVTLYDEKKNCLVPVSEAYLTNAPTRSKRAQIATATTKSDNPCANQVQFASTLLPEQPASGTATLNVEFKYLDYASNKVSEKTKTYKNTLSSKGTATAKVELYQ